MSDDDEDDDELEPLSMAELLRALARLLAPYRAQVLTVTACLGVEMAYTAAVPYGFAVLVDVAIGQHRKDVLIGVMLALAAGGVLAALIGLWRDRLDARIDAAVLTDLRRRMAAHLQSLSVSFHSRAQVGDLLARFSSDIAEVESLLEDLIPWGVMPVLDVIASTVVLFALAPGLAWPALLVFPMSLVGPWIFNPQASRASVRRQEDEGEVLSALQESFSGHQVAKAFGLDAHLLEELAVKLETLRRSSMRVLFLGLLVERTSNIGILVLDLALLGAGAWACFEGRMTVGALASFQVLFGNLSSALSYVAQYVPSLVSAAGGMARIEEILVEVPAVRDDPLALPVPRLSRAIELDHVTFRYGPERTGLEDVTLAIPAGASVAIVGPTGAGKSTLLALLLRFHDPTSGRVTFDGHDLKHVTQDSVRRQIGVVFQETFLFNTSIREAIRAGQLDASDSEVEAAARAAEVHDAILALPHGYDTLVGERGAHLSGGQRQRVGIARALIREPSILLLDEATSALDAVTEAALRATLARVSAGRTVIHVTHRLESVTQANRIFVLDRGRLVQQGTHADLLAADGVYARMWEGDEDEDADDDGEE